VKSAVRLLAFLLIGFSQGAFAQRSSLKVIAEVPLNFGIGYEGQISKHFSAGGSVGVLTSPNSDLIITYLKFIGTDEELVLMIEDAFQLGIVGELNVNYNFKRNYVGIFAQAIGAQAGDVSSELVEDYFGTSIEDYPLLNGATNLSEKNLTVRTRLYQAGMLYGRRFPLKNKRLEIDVELGLSANIGSTSKFYSENRDYSELNERFDVVLDDFYKAYAFIPSLGVTFVYKLHKPEN